MTHTYYSSYLICNLTYLAHHFSSFFEPPVVFYEMGLVRQETRDEHMILLVAVNLYWLNTKIKDKV